MGGGGEVVEGGITSYPSPCVPVSWGKCGADKDGVLGAGGGGGGPFHAFAADRVVCAEAGALRFLDFDQAKIGANLDLARDGEGAVVGELAVRIAKISEGVTYGAGGLAIGITALEDALPLTGGRCLGMAWSVCEMAVSCPRQPKAICLQTDGSPHLPASSWGWRFGDVVTSEPVSQGDLIGLTVTRKEWVEDSEGGGAIVSVELLKNGEKLGVSVSGLHLCAGRQWFFAVSGESEAVTLSRLVL